MEFEREKLEREKELREFEREKLERETATELKKLQHEKEMREYEKEMREYEKEKRESEREERERERQHELNLIDGRNRNTGNSGVFDITKFIRLVPKFNEDDVAKFFISFEKVATQLEWPKEHWAIMLQVSLTGKAQVAYSCLSVEVSGDYEEVKKAILKAYELVPEAYRQKFREVKKNPNQTYVEFARFKEQLFEDWCRAKKIGGDFSALRELILVEEFKRCIPREIKTHLEELQVDNLERSAVVSDEYALTHKTFFKTRDNVYKSNINASKDSNPKKSDLSSSGSSPKKEIICFNCGKKGHLRA